MRGWSQSDTLSSTSARCAQCERISRYSAIAKWINALTGRRETVAGVRDSECPECRNSRSWNYGLHGTWMYVFRRYHPDWITSIGKVISGYGISDEAQCPPELYLAFTSRTKHRQELRRQKTVLLSWIPKRNCNVKYNVLLWKEYFTTSQFELYGLSVTQSYACQSIAIIMTVIITHAPRKSRTDYTIRIDHHKLYSVLAACNV